MVELDVPAMVHVSASANPVFHATGAYYINADTTAFMQLVQGNLFGDLPDLRLVIPHGGGAVPYHWGRYRGLADMLGQPPVESNVMGNVYFDTCVYHQPGIDLLLDVVDTPNVLFGSEMVGAVRGIDPRTGHYYDDTRRYVEAANLDDEARTAVFEGNVRRVYPRLDAALEAPGQLTAPAGQIVSGTRRWAMATSNSAVSTTSMPMAGANSSRNSRAPSLACSRCARLS